LQAQGVRLGGFGESSVRSQMSPRLQRQIAESEEREARESARLERERPSRVGAWRERSLQAAITQALELGEELNNPRALRGEPLGHTPAEFVSLMSARQDVEDRAAEAPERREFERWKAAQSASSSGDVSAPTVRQLAEEQLMQERARRFREQEYDRRVTARGIRAGVC
jgi:hypothetical protein